MNFRSLFLLFLLGACAGLFYPAKVYASDWKYYVGAQCQTQESIPSGYTKTKNQVFRRSNGRLMNRWDSKRIKVYCPIIRGELYSVHNDTEIFAMVQIYNWSDEKVACRLETYRRNSGGIYQTSPQVWSSKKGASYLTMLSVYLENYGGAAIACDLPPGAEILNYNVKED